MKNTFLIRLVAVFAVVFAISFVSTNIATAQGNKVLIDLVDASEDFTVVGTVRVIEKKNRGDILKLKVTLDKSLYSKETIRVFLAASDDEDGKPAVYLGDFKTNPQGKGVFQVKVEILDAIAVTDAGPDPIDLDHIRLYLDRNTPPFGGDFVAYTADLND